MLSEQRRRQIGRRVFLQASCTGLGGLAASLNVSERVAAEIPARSLLPTARAKSVVVLFLYGAPSQMDTLDPKPNAPVERRGEFKSIATSLPGIAAGELLPNIAGNLHRVALVRSMTHSSNNHAVSVALSALSKSEPAIEANGQDPRHQPYFGSVLEYLWNRQGTNMLTTGVPVNMVLPWALNDRTDHNRWQHHAAWLGRAYNPIIPRFAGKGSLEVGSPSIRGTTPILTRFDPWDGVTSASTFRFDATALPSDVSADRFTGRRKLLSDLSQTGGFGRPGRAFAALQDLSCSMIAHPKVTEALDVTQEPARVREKYGATLFGQSVLAARRLVEVGVKVITVFWDTWTDNNAAWDTHSNHHPRLRDGLCPKLDQILPTFLDDMQERGLLQDTLVMVISEHGRTPVISAGPGGGREHWSGAYWGMFFGAGIRTGQVIGATDKEGAYPTERPIDPKDILATMYRLLGFDPQLTTIPDRVGRPMHLVPHGEPVHELLS